MDCHPALAKVIKPRDIKQVYQYDNTNMYRAAARGWPKIILVAMETPICYVNFTSLNYLNLKDESLGLYG